MNHLLTQRAKLSLSLQFSLAFAGMTFLSAIVLGIAAARSAQKQLEQRVGAELTHLSQSLSYNLDSNLFERYREIQIIAGLAPFRDPQTPISEQRDLLNLLQDTYPNYSWIGFANTEGIVQASTKGLLEGQNVAERPWFSNAQTEAYAGDVHEAVLLAELLPNPTGEPLRFVDVSTPVVDAQGTFQGVLGAHLSWSWATTTESLLMDSPDAEGKELFVLSRDGTVLLAPPNWQEEDPGESLNLNSVQLAQSGQDGYVVERWSDDETYLVGFTQSQGYSTYPGLGWIVLVREPTAVAFAPVQQLYWRILAGGLLFSSGFALLGWLVAARATRPLLNIATAADQIRRGNRNVAIPMLPGQNETAKLSQALNQLIRELIAHEQELKAQLATRKRMAESLHRSEEQLRQIVDNIQDALLLKEIDTGKVIYLNPGYARLHRFEVNELYEEPQVWLRSVHPEDQARVFEALQAEMRGEAFFNDEYRLLMADGSVAWVWDRSFPIRDETGQIYRCAVIKRDITDRKYSEELLRTLMESTASATGHSFFPTLVQHLAVALGVDHAFVAEQVGSTLKMLSFWSEGQFRPNVTYYIEDTPCKVIVEDGSYYCASEVSQRFPSNPHLQALQAQGYLGVALRNALGEVLGTLCIISKQPLGNRNHYAGILHIFAIRAAAELERQRSEMALRASEERFRLLAENVRDLVCLHDPNGRFLYLSPSCASLLGFEPLELVGKNPYKLLHPDDRETVQVAVRQLAQENKQSPVVYRACTKTGEYIWLESLVKSIADEQGEEVYFQTSSRDVTDKVLYQERLQHDAVHDSLTGLPNRSLLLERLNLALERLKRHGDFYFAVLFIDLDRFKTINDSLGHLVGDRLLLEVAAKLKTVIRPIDLAVRLGGDEFVLLIEEMNGLQEAIRIAERILDHLRTPINLETHEVVVGASIGIVMSSTTYENSQDLLRDADLAMYSAKAKGRGCYAIFNPAMHQQALRQLELENDLRRAVEQQEFTLRYQPIVALPTEELLGFEVLVRWQHPSKGIIPPIEFIPIAEETGLIVQLGQWILREACQQMVQWQQQFPAAADLKISVNLSVRQLKESDFLTQIECILAETGLPGSSLALEITESMLMYDIEPISELLTHLRNQSIQISIDDFGTGFSSLSYLHRLPVNNLKIDRSFISQLLDSQRNLNITKTIIALADQMGIDAIAEGIETTEQLQQLQTFGCELGQGYLFSAPVTAQAAESLIDSLSLPE